MQVQPHQIFHLLPVVYLIAVQAGFQVVQLVRVGLLAEDGGAVVVLERVLNRVHVILEVEHERIVLLGMGSVQPGEGLYGLDSRERLVHVHRVQQRLVVAGLELVGHDQEAVRVSVRNVSAILLLGKPFSDASVTFWPSYSCSPEKATIAW